MSSKPLIDWERIELDYRAGVKSLREIGAEYGVSHPAINKRAKKEGWSRDLNAKIQAKADELVTKAAVTREVTTVTTVTERETIDANAQAIAGVKLAHRKDIQRARSITMALFGELELMAGPENAELLAELGHLLRQPDTNGNDKLNDMYQRIIRLPERAKVMKDLGESLRVMVQLERQAFGLDDKDNAPVDPLTSLLHGIAKAGANNGFKPVTDDPEHGED